MNTVLDELTVSMVEVDAAAARAALAPQLALVGVDLEHPAVVAVLAAVVAAGWRPPVAPGGTVIVADPAPGLFDPGFGGAESPADSPERAQRWGFPW